jgi:hypothetical protein
MLPGLTLPASRSGVSHENVVCDIDARYEVELGAGYA